jgi:hypothetical protein
MSWYLNTTVFKYFNIWMLYSQTDPKLLLFRQHLLSEVRIYRRRGNKIITQNGIWITTWRHQKSMGEALVSGSDRLTPCLTRSYQLVDTISGMAWQQHCSGTVTVTLPRASCWCCRRRAHSAQLPTTRVTRLHRAKHHQGVLAGKVRRLHQAIYEPAGPTLSTDVVIGPNLYTYRPPLASLDLSSDNQSHMHT